MTIDEIKATLAIAGLRCRPIWRGNDGALRVGHSGDMVTMLEDLRIAAIGYYP